ncbi:trace amine-associated receptor 7e-like [Montipora capricornis]|uniref:trace amine-associated receptor 7e-like n=1 Tax=Montipora capricornis TaxID=246305 RepID=UPI0035F16E1A
MTNLCIKELTQPVSVTLASLYGISALPAILGNAAFLGVILKSRSLRTVSNLLLSSLALADLLVGLVIDPMWVIRCILAPRPYDHPLKIAIDLLWIQTSVTTTFSLCVVSLDRYIAVRSAALYNQIMTHERCYAAVTFVWIASFAFGLSRVFVKDPATFPKLWMSVAITTILLPMVLITFCYIRIFVLARKQSRSISMQISHLETFPLVAEAVRNRKTAKTVGLVIGLFLISWSPSLVTSFIHFTAKAICTKINMRLVWLWVELLAFASSGVNPWLYSMRNNEFRNEMMRVFGLRRFLSRRMAVRVRPRAFTLSTSANV